MKIFLTGATGYIGQALVKELTAAGHAVTGLVRSSEKAAVLAGLGAQAVVGDMKKPETYRDAAAAQEALIHAAAEYSAEGVAADQAAISTLLAAAGEGTVRSLVFTSGIWVLGATGGTPAFEDASTAHAAPLVVWRPVHEQQVLAAATETLATAVVRPGMVYGGSSSLIGSYFASAVKDGASQYVGDGTNRIPMIHVEDLVRFFRAVVEHHGRGIFHAVDGLATPLIEVARAASEAAGKGGATRSLALEDARKKMGPMADCLVLDQVVQSRRNEELGWHLQHPSFVAEAAAVYREWLATRG